MHAWCVFKQQASPGVPRLINVQESGKQSFEKTKELPSLTMNCDTVIPLVYVTMCCSYWAPQMGSCSHLAKILPMYYRTRGFIHDTLFSRKLCDSWKFNSWTAISLVKCIISYWNKEWSSWNYKRELSACNQFVKISHREKYPAYGMLLSNAQNQAYCVVMCNVSKKYLIFQYQYCTEL